MHITYEPKGICARKVEFDIEDGVVKNISFLGGCDGNHKGLAALAEGMTPEEAAVMEAKQKQILDEMNITR